MHKERIGKNGSNAKTAWREENSTMAKTRPNILLIMADQLAPQFLPAYGHPVVKTPHLDGLCEDAVIFDAAYCNAPLCAPARYTLMSGRQPSHIGAWDNAAEFAAEIPTFAHHLAAAGYRTCLSGKMHFCGPDQLHGFEDRLTTDVYPADFSWTPDWDDPQRRLDYYHTMDVVREAGPCLRSAYLDFDDEVTFAATRYLFDLARGGDERPFCLVAAYIHPHDPYINRPEYWDLYNDDAIDPPAIPAAAAPRDVHSERLIQAMGMDDPWPSEATVRRARRAYYASTSYIDAQVGALMRALNEAGFADDTVVLFTSDHGDMLGERGLWFKMSWFEHSARVPLIVRAPGTFAPRRVASAVSHVDLMATLAEIANDGAPFGATPTEGRSLLPHLSGRDGHDEVIGEYFGEGTVEPLFMIRRGTRKFVTAAEDPPQLYDLAADPHEMANLAENPNHAAEVEAFRAEAASRWDASALKERVLESQRRRHFIAPIQRAQGRSWDYTPPADGTRTYIRNHLSIAEIERRSRFPTV